MFTDSSRKQSERPTVLLNRNDVNAELSSLSSRLRTAHSQVDVWSAGLPDKIADLWVHATS